MVCFYPITVWQQTEARLDIPANDYYELKKISFREIPGRLKIQIPCGHCLGCRLDHAAMWATRIALEAKQWKNCCFVTLTYNNKNLPFKNNIPTLRKKDLQDFMKRLRYHEKGIEKWDRTKEEYPIRYFACGEYGPKGGRPHYHLAIFNWKPDDLKPYKLNKHEQQSYTSKKLQEIWGKGFCVIEDLNYTSASYIARYVQKKAGIDPEHYEYTGEIIPELAIDERNGNIFTKYKRTRVKKSYPQEKEFITMSRAVGIGRIYWEKNKDKIKNNKGILLKIEDNVKVKKIPQYFNKLWENEDWEEYYRFKYYNQEKYTKIKAEIISKINTISDDANVKWEFYLNTSKNILTKKAKYLKRNEFI